jgi:hypothetical protein
MPEKSGKDQQPPHPDLRLIASSGGVCLRHERLGPHLHVADFEILLRESRNFRLGSELAIGFGKSWLGPFDSFGRMAVHM